MSETNLTQSSFSSGILSTEMFSRIDFSKLASGLKQCQNFVIRPAGGAIYRVGTEFLNYTKLSEEEATSGLDVSLIPFIYNRSDGLCLEFGGGYIWFYKDGKRLDYELTTPYSADDVQSIKYAQYENQLVLVHPNYPPKILTRNSDTDWTLRDMVFNPAIQQVQSVTITSGTAKETETVVEWSDWQYAISVVNTDGKEGLPVYSNTITNDIDLTNQPINISFTKPADTTDIESYNVYRIRSGDFYFIYNIKESANKTTLEDISLAVDTTQSPKEEFTAFSDGDYPAAVGFWNQRLLLGCTTSKPSTFWGSCVDTIEDFTNTAVNGADEAFELTFNSGSLDAITDFVPLDDLIVFTQGKIWRVVGTSANDMAAYIESYSGCSGLRPFATKKSILYVDSSYNTVSNFVYSYELNGYVGQNLDLLARELLEGYTVKDISFRDTPYGVMYSIRNDGAMLGLTYLREENIFAWHIHKTEGLYKNVCAIDRNQNDDVYVVVDRGGKRCVEMFKSYIDPTEDINDSWHLDCARRYGTSWFKWETTVETVKTRALSAYTAYDTYNRILQEFSADYGDFQSAVCTLTMTQDREDWLYAISLHFANGTLPILLGKNSTTLTIDTSLFDSDTNSALNSAVYDFITSSSTYGQWINAIASDKAHYMMWTDTDAQAKNALIYEDATIMGWYHGNNTVFQTTITFEDTGSQLLVKKNGTTIHTFNFTATESGSIFVNGTDVYMQSDSTWTLVGSISSSTDTTATYNGTTYTRNSSKDTSYNYTESTTSYLYTNGAPAVDDYAYTDTEKSSPQTITAVGTDTVTVNDTVYNLSAGQSLDAATQASSLDEDLSYFTECGFDTVSVLVDTQLYENVPITDGKIPADIQGVNFLVGLPYTGILETIPHDLKYSSGNTTVGVNRKINDGVLSYYRSRGLQYGVSEDKLYEIKPYTQETYSYDIPLETGKLLLKAADGFSLETSFFVVQKNPFPALIQSITLGETYYGKN